MKKIKKEKPVPKKTTTTVKVKKTTKRSPKVKSTKKTAVPRSLKPKKEVVEVTPIPKPAIETPKVVIETPKVKERIKKPRIEKKIKPVQIEKEPEISVIPPSVPLKELELDFPVAVKDLAVKLQQKPSLIIKTLMGMRVMVGINQSLDESTVKEVCEKYGYGIRKAPGKEELALQIHQKEDHAKDLKFRAPVVTLMGHVDHGKTSLLDAIRKTNVVDREHGGITQHIGAYRVVLPRGEITFLDTPGHEAFTAMRARGASITDLVVLVVAADDGIMPQTQEAIDHARAAEVPIIVAINKIDKTGVDIDRVKKQLSKNDLVAEGWGGKTVTVPVSAKTGEGVDNLLEMIILEAQMLELKANPDRIAQGVVVEAKMTKGRGPVSTLLIQNGTLKLNHNIIVGKFYGKIRAMFDDHGRSVTSALPGCPVEVLGISGVPLAGEQFFVIEDEKKAKELAALRLNKEKQDQMKTVKKISLEDLHSQIEQGKIKELKLIIKADVQGTLEATKDVLGKLQVSEIKIGIIHTGVGNINTSDVVLAVASNALIIGFNVVADARAKEMVSKEGIEIKTYNVIYELANDIKAAVEGMLEPKIKKVMLGKCQIRKVFRLSSFGTIAGCIVNKGKINRSCMVDLVRNGQVVFEGKLLSLKRFKDDVKEVAEGFECGIALAGFDQIQEGDVIEAYELQKIARKL
ncbi:MAG: translation initiation factor IF-2 [Candidatus Omnitrophota bacterium]